MWGMRCVGVPAAHAQRMHDRTAPRSVHVMLTLKYKAAWVALRVQLRDRTTRGHLAAVLVSVAALLRMCSDRCTLQCQLLCRPPQVGPGDEQYDEYPELEPGATDAWVPLLPRRNLSSSCTQGCLKPDCFTCLLQSPACCLSTRRASRTGTGSTACSWSRRSPCGTN